MANIIRKNQKVFAENAVNNGQFGSLQDTTKILTQDLDILQANPAYKLGWNNATISGEKLPTLEEFQSLNYINTSQITYLLNKGIPEWVVDAEYYIGDIQREIGGTKLYKSITNNNIGNILTNITHWVLLVDLAAVSVLPASQSEVNAGVVTDKFVAPSTLRFGFAASFTPNGYIAFPSWLGGLIIQWGTSVNTGTSTLVTFPIPFPTTVRHISYGNVPSSLLTAGNYYQIGHNNLSLLGFNWGGINSAGVVNSTPSTMTALWLGIGV